MSLFSFAKTEFKNLFSKPATRPYPQQPREYPERTRGHIENDMDVCILCGLCSKKCPTGAITVDRAGKTWSISGFSCIQCGYCVESCPKKCLSMKQSYTQPDAQKGTNTFVKPEQPVPAKPAVEAAKPAPTPAKPAADAEKPSAVPAVPTESAEPAVKQE